jgi:hypothetical protein
MTRPNSLLFTCHFQWTSVVGMDKVFFEFGGTIFFIIQSIKRFVFKIYDSHIHFQMSEK